mgnify:CR=1 FL=1
MISFIKKMSSIFRFIFTKYKIIFNDLNKIEQINRQFGFDSGTTMDSYYKAKFLTEYSNTKKMKEKDSAES